MPSNLSAASPSGVLPQSLCTAFAESREYPMLTQQYHDGTIERSIITDGINAPTSLKSWRIAKRLLPAQVATLKAFYEGQQGCLVPFYFYNPIEGSPIGSNYDASGTNTTGRHTVVFTNQSWMEVSDIARSVLSIEMREVA